MELKQTELLSQWKITTPASFGLHEVVSPKSGITRSLWAYRLNLKKNETVIIGDDVLELSFVMIKGSARVSISECSYEIERFDSFYLPARTKAVLQANEDVFLYGGGAVYEGYGDVFVHEYNPQLSVGDVRQVHGKEPYRRDVYMTLGPDVPASRLICGLTWSDNGAWSSWPPHQHEKDLEEAYCYFDMDPPHFGMHLSFLKSGNPTYAHIVHTGDIVLAPEGYHPTVAAPSNKNCYFWILAAHSHKSRRYDLAVSDPAYIK
jgi:5-deoxy-glucuronate isomerase